MIHPSGSDRARRLLATMAWASATRLAAGVAAGAVAVAIGWFVWKTRADPDVPWLAARGPAHWIVYPAPADMVTRRIVLLHTVFRREFRLARVPASAVLRFRAFRDVDVRINGEGIAATQQ